MRELPPTSFTFGNYNADIPTSVYIDSKELLKWLKEQNIVGYSRNPFFKPLDGYVAVLIQDKEDNWEGWSHIPDHVFNKLLIPDS